MPRYKTKEITAGGQVIEKIEESKNQEEVIAAIRGRNNRPLSIEEIEETSKEIKLGFKRKKKVSAKDLSIFSKQLHTMINAGMPLLASIETLKQQVQNKNLKEALADIYLNLQKGAIFSTTLLNHQDVFPELYCSMVRSGELTGNLDIVVENLAIHYEKDAKIQAQIKAAMMYPIIVLLFAIGVTILLIVKLVPMFTEMLEGAPLPGITKFVIGLSDFIIAYWYMIIAVLAGIFIAFRAYAKSTSGRLSLDKKQLEFPVIKKYIKTIISARFASTLAVLINSGIPLIKGIESAIEVTNNKYVEKKMQGVTENIKKGSPMSVELAKLEIFPPMMISMIKIGEDSGSIDTMLTKTSEFYEEEMEEAIRKLTALMEPLIIVFIGGIVAVVLLSIYLPMFELSTGAGLQ